MEWSLFHDSEETIPSTEKKTSDMKAFSVCIDKNTQIFIWKSQWPKKKLKTKQNVFFQLHQFSIFLMKISWIGSWVIELIDVKGIDVVQPIWSKKA